MKSRRSLSTKPGHQRNGTIQKSPSASCVSNNSITSMFERQQQRWDAMWATVSNTSMETNSSALSVEGELHLSKDGINDDKQNDDIYQNNNQPMFNHLEKTISKNCNSFATESAGVKKPIAQKDSIVPVTDQKDATLFEHLAGQSNDHQMLSKTVPSRRLSLKRKRRSFGKGSVTTPSSNSPGRPDHETARISASSSEPVVFHSEISNAQSRNDASLVDARRTLDSVIVKDFVQKPEATSVEPEGIRVSSSDSLAEAASEPSSAAEPKHMEYYLENFLLILDVVTADEYYTGLFDEDDMATVQTFRNTLNENARKLYVRLFLRKHKWLRREKITYPLIAEDLTETLGELTSNGLLYDDTSMTSLEEAVQCLPAPELKSLAKSLHINPSSSKASLSGAIVKHAQRCDVTNFFSQTTGSTEKMIMKRTKNLLGRCYKLAVDKRSIFIRFMILFGLHNTLGDDESYGQQLIFQMLMNQIGRVKYPEYKILRKTRIFAGRETVIRYAEALQLESDLCDALEKKDYDQCLKMYLEAKGTADSLLKNPELIEVDTTLPFHLRHFTPGAIYVRLLTHGVEILQFVKKYEDAVIQLRELLDQSVYHRDYRGRWYDRLALNVDYHLKQPLEALEVIKLALNDDCVRTGHRYNLLQRAKKICSSSTIKKSTGSAWDPFQDDSMNSVQEAPSVTILGQQLYRGLPRSGSIWLSTDSTEPSVAEAKVITRVEEVALRHYAENGFPEGIHGEGATFRCLFGLFMWDILFIDNIEDVFYNEYQTYPLDILSDAFYTNREKEITERLKQIASSSNQELCDIVSEAWNEHQDALCLGLNWELFRDCSHAVGLVRCFGGRILAGIFERMARMMRNVTGGVPDLIVWNPDSEKFKVVEVKGPGDRLSSKQVLWLDYLLRIGADAEVCHVRAVGAKNLSNTR